MSLRLVPEQIFKDKDLAIGGPTTFSKEIVMDKRGIAAFLLEIAITLVVGTGTTAKAEGELLIVKNIRHETDLDKESHNAPGRALYNFASFAKKIAPDKTAIAATDGVYKVAFPLFFSDPLAQAPFFSMLDTRRYDGVELSVLMGTVADLLGTVGTAAITAKATLTAMKTEGVLPANFGKKMPRFYPSYKAIAGVPHTDLEKALPRIPDLRLRRIMYMLLRSATAGVPFSGTPNDAGVTNVTIEKGDNYSHKKVTRTQLASDNKEFFKLRPTGAYMLDFMPEGSFEESQITHPDAVSKLNMTWETDDATATVVDLLVDGAKTLKTARG